MFFLHIWPSVALTAIVISVSGYEYSTGARYLNTNCPLCNTTYTIYTCFLRVQIILLSILGSLNAQNLFHVTRSIENLAENARLSIYSKRKHFAVCLMLIIASLRVYADFRLDSLWIFRLTNHFSFLFTLRSTMRFVRTLAPIRDAYNGLKAEIRGGNAEDYRTAEGGSEIRGIQELANDAFGKQACLIQFGILFGSAVNAYLLAYLNLQGWSSTSLNFFLFLDAVEYGFTACSFAANGNSTFDSAMALVVETTRFSANLRNFNCFKLVKQLALSNLSEPPNITAWTFYPLNMESLFSTISTTAAFVFVLLQFNSVYSNFDFPVD